MLSCAAVKRAMVATVVAASLLAACSTGDDGGSGTTTRPKATHTTMSPDEAAVRKVAEEWANATDRLVRSPNPSDPALDRLLTGPMLAKFRADMTRRVKDELVARSPERSVASHTIKDVQVDGDRAVVLECFVDDLLLVDKASGAILNDSVSTYATRTVATRIGSRWKLSERTSRRTGGVSGCAA